ncbi:hypothetical protein Zmor_006363 [Zophobas morio]|uniref:Gustatory receptor n=1 Tax=Zophobas morio TaxID=2755281 RepID=A0AA38IZS5_9CUCU|nr:hypothetical protein Zmor_006363 [Zophobas morio]
MTTHSVDLFEPVFKVWKYSTLPHYEISSRNKIICKKNRLWWFLIATTIVHTIAIFYLMEFQAIFKNFVHYYEVSLNTLQSWGIMLTCQLRKHQFCELLSDFLLIETKLTNLTRKTLVTTKVRRLFMSAIVIKYCLIVIIAVLDFFLAEKRVYVEIAAIYVCWLLDFHVEILLVCLLIILHKAYSGLYEYVNQNRQTWDNLRKSVDIHEQLREISIKFNRAFGPFILLKFWSDFVFLTFGMFECVHFLLRRSGLVRLVANTVADIVWSLTVVITRERKICSKILRNMII